MISENIDREFFHDDIPLEDRIVADDGSVERRAPGTLTLLERWLRKRYLPKNGEDVSFEVLKPFRDARKLRQPQAHSLIDDQYDLSCPRRQDELLGQATQSLTRLRLILSSHPAAKEYTAPRWLDGDEIVFY